MISGLDLFTGIGGITLSLQEYVQPLCYCEIEPYAQSVLLQRMQEGHLPKAPIWDDIRTLSTEGFPPIDIIYGGFPCQDISVAGNAVGLEGKRSGLFFEILRLLDETQAPFIFVENVPNIRTKGAERVCKELAERGYDCRWCCVSACDVGAPHKRERWFLLAYNKSIGCNTERLSLGKEKAHAISLFSGKDVANARCESERSGEEQERPPLYSARCGGQWEVEPCVDRVVDGLPSRVDRVKALGNAVVPKQCKIAFEILLGLFEEM